MKIAFIYPKFERFLESRTELGEISSLKHLGNFKMPPALGIPILSALSKDKHELKLYDENIEEIDYNDDADLIAVSFFTPQANFAFEIAKKFRQKGKTVIAGGMHPSLMPEEVSIYFDAVCVGEVEGVWNEILSDFQQGKLKKIYQGGYPEMNQVPLPDRSLFEEKNKYDWGAKLIQTMRGCCFNCETCIVPAEFGKKFRFKSMSQILEEINSEPIKGDYYLIDDTLVLPHRQCFKFREELLKTFAQLSPKPRLFMSGSLQMNTEPDYLKTLVDGGVVSLYLVTGCDPFSVKAFQKGEKRYFDWGIDIVNSIQDAGIKVFISVGYGFDYQDNSVFDTSLNFIQKAKIDTSEFYLVTPFPQTPIWHQFRKEDRILHYNWTKYNTANVVFKPKNFTEQELLDGYINSWKESYCNDSSNKSLKIFEK
ncbi:MAG: cobalamin-dependent protein [Bacteroidota bacterium]